MGFRLPRGDAQALDAEAISSELGRQVQDWNEKHPEGRVVFTVVRTYTTGNATFHGETPSVQVRGDFCECFARNNNQCICGEGSGYTTLPLRRLFPVSNHSVDDLATRVQVAWLPFVQGDPDEVPPFHLGSESFQEAIEITGTLETASQPVRTWVELEALRIECQEWVETHGWRHRCFGFVDGILHALSWAVRQGPRPSLDFRDEPVAEARDLLAAFAPEAPEQSDG